MGQAECTQCPAGFYCALHDTCNQTNTTLPVACPPGYYCPAGTMAANQNACPAGTFNPEAEGKTLADCWACTPGQYCGTPGQSATSGPCSAGHYCSGGANTTTPVDGVTGGLCPTGAYCVAGSIEPMSRHQPTPFDLYVVFFTCVP